MTSRYPRLALVALASLLSLTSPVSAALPRAEIVFISSANDQPSVRAIRPSQKRPRLVAEGYFRYPTWSPDRSQIAFVELSRKDLAPTGLWVADRDGSNERELVEFDHGEHYSIGFDWSPDGTQIVYSDKVDPESNFDLFIVTVATKEVRRLTDDAEHEEEPDWSPGGDEIVYQRVTDQTEDSFNYDVYKVSVDDGSTTRLTTNEWQDTSPMWSPDGSQIVFFSTRDDYHSESGPYLWELYLVAPDGSDERRLTEQATRKMTPVWSPDGKSIAYNSRCDDDVCGGDYDDNIYVVRVEDGRLKRLTGKGKRSETDPSWSPDSNWIVFTVVQRGGRTSDLTMIRVRDRRIESLTETSKRAEYQPQWAPGRPGGTDW